MRWLDTKCSLFVLFCFVNAATAEREGPAAKADLCSGRGGEMFGNTFQYLWVVFRKERGISEPLFHASASAPQRASSARTRPVISKPSAQDSN